MNRKANRPRLGQVLDRLHAEVQTRAISESEPDVGVLNADIAQTAIPDLSTRDQKRVRHGRPLATRLAFGGIAGLPGAGVVILSLIVLAQNLASNLYLIAAILTLGSGMLLFLTGLIAGLILRPVIITPARYRAGQVRAHPGDTVQFPPDPAWPLYPFGQAGLDRRVVRLYVSILTWRVGLIYFRALRRAWQRPGNALSRAWWLFFPVAAAVMVFLLAVGLSAWCCYAVYWLVSIAFTYVAVAAVVLIAAFLRMLDVLWLRKRQDYVLCVECFHMAPRPVFTCPWCARVHRDIRPGRLGLFTRRCECGMRLPTRAPQAARQLTALCPRCWRPLWAGPGVIRDVWVPIFGDRSAGKTRFLYAALNSLLQSAEQAGVTISFPDPGAEYHVALGLEAIRSGHDMPASSPSAPLALTIRLGHGRKAYQVRLFDAAGERYRDARQYERLRFLDHAQGLVYVLDPFSIQDIQNLLTGHNATGGPPAHAAVGGPEITFGEVVSRMRDSGVPARAQRLAVVVTKADLLRETDLKLPGESEGIALWLRQAGMDNLIRAMGRDFAEVRFFAVTSQDASAGWVTGEDDPAAPLRWLLGRYGVPLSASPALHQRSGRSRAAPVPGAVRHRQRAHATTVTPGARPAPHSSESQERPPREPVPETTGSGASGAGNSSGGAGFRREMGPGAPEQPPVRHLTADLPERAPAGRRISLIVRITLAAPSSGSVPLERLSVPAEGCEVTVTVSAPALVTLGDLEQDVHVPARADSEPVRFSFTTARAGLHRVLVRAFAGGTFLGELALQISVEIGAVLEEGPSRATALAGLAAEPGEVTLQVSRTVGGGYSFQLLSEALYPAVLVDRLAGDPATVIGQMVAELRTMSKGTSRYATPALARRRLRSLGSRLWADVVPIVIREQFWAQRTRIKSFTIASDMDTVPWELLYPVDVNNDEGFLAEQFPVVRRVYGQGRARVLRLDSGVGFIVPPESPTNAMDEVAAVCGLLPIDVVNRGIQAGLAEVLEMLDAVPSVLHFAGHNAFTDESGSLIGLDGGPLRPDDLSYASQRHAFESVRPLVFLNGCRTAGEIPGFTHLVGWAREFMGAGAGAFIGSLWAVRSSSARTFAEQFYHALVREGESLGIASLRARQAIAWDEGDPTWLAYTVYGNPSASVVHSSSPIPRDSQ